jgi:hypothetical protein
MKLLRTAMKIATKAPRYTKGLYYKKLVIVRCLLAFHRLRMRIGGATASPHEKLLLDFNPGQGNKNRG